MRHDSGVILVNVLVVLAIGSAITVLMFTSQQSLLERSARAAAATQAQALAMGAETSVQLALQRDMIEAPETDHYAEDWALVAQQDVELATGQFSVQIVDAQAGFNLNTLVQPGVVQPQTLQRLTRALALPDSVPRDLIRHIQARGAITNLDEIDLLDTATRDTLRPHVTALSPEAQVNLNTAGETVMAAVVGSGAAAKQLIRQREQVGFLTQADLANSGVLVANGAGFTSDTFDVTSVAEVDGVTAVLRSRINRVTGVGQRQARVTRRTWGAQ